MPKSILERIASADGEYEILRFKSSPQDWYIRFNLNVGDNHNQRSPFLEKRLFASSKDEAEMLAKKECLELRILKASMNNIFEIELTTILGCSVQCIYCPQEQLIKSRGSRKRQLEFNDFVLALENIDIDLDLAWTGYSEPCLSPFLGKMIEYAHESGFNQTISTTLSGNPNSVSSVIEFKNWKLFSFHLPDSDNLMPGLKVDPDYIEMLDFALNFRLRVLKQAARTRMICFGEKFHPKVHSLISKYVSDGLIPQEYVKLRGKVHGRSGGLDGKNIGKFLYYRSAENHLSSENPKNDKFYCSRLKLNQPCLLPDGDLNICSYDYGFRNIYGNLFSEKLSTIYSKWINKIYPIYLSGELSPCAQCEYYVPI